MTILQTVSLRIKLAFIILFRPKKFWVMIMYDKDDLNKIFNDADDDVRLKVKLNGVKPYMLFKTIKRFASYKDDIDMALDKAQYEAELELGKISDLPK